MMQSNRSGKDKRFARPSRSVPLLGIPCRRQTRCPGDPHSSRSGQVIRRKGHKAGKRWAVYAYGVYFSAARILCPPIIKGAKGDKVLMNRRHKPCVDGLFAGGNCALVQSPRVKAKEATRIDPAVDRVFAPRAAWSIPRTGYSPFPHWGAWSQLNEFSVPL